MSLTEAQRRAVAAVDTNCCVVSIPGSGKTTTVVAKIQHILEARPHAKVVAVTFTAEAAKELLHRVQEKLKPDAASRLTTGTFHALLLKAFRDEDHPLTKRRLASEGEARLYVDSALEFAKLKPSEASRRWFESARNRLRHRYEVLEAGVADAADTEDTIESIEIAMRRYDDLMLRAGMFDFTMLLREAIDWAPAKGSRKRNILGATHLLVDEFQDIDGLMLQLITNVADSGGIVTGVGDDDQAIYQFRDGLGYAGMTEFIEKTNAMTITMDTNFRCKSEILDWAGQVIVQNRFRLPKTLKASRGKGGRIELLCYATDEEEFAGTARRCKQEIGGTSASVAILARSNWLLDEMELACEAMGLDYQRIGGKSVWEVPPLCHFLGYLRALTSDSEIAGFEAMLKLVGMGRHDLRKLHEIDAAELNEAIRGPAKVPNGLSTQGRSLVERLKELTELTSPVAKSTSPHDADVAVVSVLRWISEQIMAGVRDKTAAAERQGLPKGTQTTAIDDALELLGKLGRGAEVIAGSRAMHGMHGMNERQSASAVEGMAGSLKQRVLRLGGQGKEKPGDGARLKLTSMHSAKGLEFQSTYVIGVAHHIIPGKNTSADEERRLLYVAMTRAKDTLRVSYARKYTRNKRSREGRLCAFLADGRIRHGWPDVCSVGEELERA